MTLGILTQESASIPGELFLALEFGIQNSSKVGSARSSFKQV
jgi:hypothetical protein